MSTDKHREQLVALERSLRQPLAGNAEFMRWFGVYRALQEFDAAARVAAEKADSERLLAQLEGEQADQARKTHIDFAIEALMAKGHPLSTIKLVPEMEKFGFQMRGKVKTLTERFSKSKKHLEQIEWNGSKGWWPVGQPRPPEPGESKDSESKAAGAATND
jgi:hypothetical protein